MNGSAHIPFINQHIYMAHIHQRRRIAPAVVRLKLDASLE